MTDRSFRLITAPPDTRQVATSDHRTPAVLGLGYILCASVLFGINGTVSKLAMLSGLSSNQLVLLRIAGAAVIYVLIAAVRQRRGLGSLRVSRAELPHLILLGVVGVTLLQWTYFVAIERLPVGVALLVEYTAPVMVALWVLLVRHEPVRSRVWGALALCLGGLALVAQVWQGLSVDGVGLAFGFAAAACLAAYWLIGEQGMSRRDPWSLCAWIFCIGTLPWVLLAPVWSLRGGMLTAPARLPEAGLFGGGAEVPVWLLVCWVVVLGTVVPFTLTLMALHSLGATRTGLVATTEPVFAALVAWIVLGESLVAVQLIGAAVIMVGIVLAETARRAPDGLTAARSPGRDRPRPRSS
jgi:drug/metabolite transporter (DMT)-like permease